MKYFLLDTGYLQNQLFSPKNLWKLSLLDKKLSQYFIKKLTLFYFSITYLR